jgi:hypothetical protein
MPISRIDRSDGWIGVVCHARGSFAAENCEDAGESGFHGVFRVSDSG